MSKLVVAALLVAVPASGCVAAGVTTMIVGAGVATTGVVVMPGTNCGLKCLGEGLAGAMIFVAGVATMLVGGGIYVAERP